MAETTRTYRANQNAPAGVMLTETSALIIGDDRHLIAVDDRGTTIKGPISFVADAMGIRTGGLFVGLNDFLNMIPSTIVSPIPKQIPFPPIFGLVNLTKDVAFFASLLV